MTPAPGPYELSTSDPTKLLVKYISSQGDSLQNEHRPTHTKTNPWTSQQRVLLEFALP